MDRPGSPQVTLVAECHVGSLEYFHGIRKVLGDSRPEVWVGFEKLREVENESGMTRAIRKRVGLLRQDRALRSQLAELVGLVSRQDALGRIKGTNVDITMDEFAADMGFWHVMALRAMVKNTQKQVERSKAGDKTALERCRLDVVRRLCGIAKFLQMPERVERTIHKDVKRNERAFALMTRKLEEGCQARLLMGAMHILVIRQMLEAKGYTVSSEEWLDCADLRLLA